MLSLDRNPKAIYYIYIWREKETDEITEKPAGNLPTYTSDQGQPLRNEATYTYAVHHACHVEHNNGCKPCLRSLCSANCLASVYLKKTTCILKKK